MAFNGKRNRKRKGCEFCGAHATSIDYKDTKKLLKFTSERGKILPRRVTGNCAKHQRMLTTAVKRSRIVALLPFVQE